MYAVLEHNFQIREGDEQRTVIIYFREDKQWFELLALITAISVFVGIRLRIFFFTGVVQKYGFICNGSFLFQSSRYESNLRPPQPRCSHD